VAPENDRYSYRVMWSEEDGEYVGLCTEFPSLSWLAGSQDEAFAGIRRVVADVVADMRAGGEVPPEPIASKSYSGKFMVRVPPETHRALALEAAEAGVSLNRIVSTKLSRREASSRERHG
jgi:predicted HicB family RNase H-like nuclease